MNGLVIVEGRLDEALMTRLLKHQRISAKLIVANGQSSALSMARSHLAINAPRVSLILDADTDKRDELVERKQAINALLADVAPASRWSLVLMVPTIEAVILGAPIAARFLLKRATRTEDLTAAGSRRALVWDRAETLRRIREGLSAPAVSELLHLNPDLQHALDFLKSPVATAA